MKKFRFRNVLTKNRVLLLGGDVFLARKLGKIFKNRGFIFKRDKTSACLDEVRDFRPHIILIDFLPFMKSVKMCAAIKQNTKAGHLPVIILGEGPGRDRKTVKCLSAGAEDYLSKPLDTALFIARVGVIMRRMLFQAEPEEIISAGDVTLNLTAHTVKAASKPLKLAPKEFALLYFLMKRSGSVLTRRALIRNVWESRYFTSMRTVDVHVRSLRKKLGSAGKHIKAVEGIGYKFSG